MKIEVTTKKYDVWPHHTPGTHVFLIKNPRLAKKVNSVLNSYEKDARFTANDEPTFRVTQDKLNLILELVGYKGVRGG